MPVVPRDYYSFTPTRTHETGDIWSGLPTLGILPTPRVHGVIITPACDLENLKVEMVTYLPIVPVRSFLRSPAIVKIIKAKLIGLLQAERRPVTWPNDTTLPSPQEMAAIKAGIETVPEQQRSNNLNRCLTSITCLQQIAEGLGDLLDPADLVLAYGANDYSKVREDLIRNRRSETHFLPADEEPAEVSAVPEHSLALFRYGLSAPIDIFELANTGNAPGWRTSMQEMATTFPVAEAFSNEIPLKRGRLKNPFLGDLLTRYVGIYVRLGSPDFTDQQVVDFAGVIN